MSDYELRLQNARKRAARMAAARGRGVHTQADWQRLLAVFRGLCPRCRKQFPRFDKDHIVPVYQGGSDGLLNLQPLCAWCNAGKGPEDVDWRWSAADALGERATLEQVLLTDESGAKRKLEELRAG